MKLSIVIAVLNSHEIVRRQLLHFASMVLPDDVELILVDDGSNPPLPYPNNYMKNLRFLRTYDTRPWTQPTARNMGVEVAHGDYVLCTDIDHIVPSETIDAVLETPYDVVRFRRYVATLDESGRIADDAGTLAQYGYHHAKRRISAHGNSYAIRRDLFLKLGGSQQKASYPNRDEVPLKRTLKTMAARGEVSIIPADERPPIYLIPNGRHAGDRNADPLGLFHGLQR